MRSSTASATSTASWRPSTGRSTTPSPTARTSSAACWTFTVWGAPETVRECLYVTDQIEAILAADAAFENTILNCAVNAPVTIDEVGRTILEVLCWEAEIVYPPDSFRGTSRKVLDSTRFLRATGWGPRIDLADGLARLAEHMRDEGGAD